MIIWLLIFLLSISFSQFQYSMDVPQQQHQGVLIDKDRFETVVKYIYRGWDSFVRRQLDNGVPVNACDDSGRTLLHHACDGSKHEVVALLLARGADAHIRAGFYSITPLIEAIKIDTFAPTVVAQLLEHDACVYVKGIDSYTPLHYAVEAGSVNIAIVLLVKARHHVDYKLGPNDNIEDAVKLITDFRIMEGKKLLQQKTKHTCTPLALAKMRLKILCERTDLKKYEVERREGLAQLIPLLQEELFEDHFKDRIEEDVRKILGASKKK